MAARCCLLQRSSPPAPAMLSRVAARRLPHLAVSSWGSRAPSVRCQASSGTASRADLVSGKWAGLKVQVDDLAASHTELLGELEQERARRMKQEQDFSVKEKASAAAADKKLQEAQSKVASLEKTVGGMAEALTAVLKAADTLPNRAQVVAALTAAAETAGDALPAEAASALVGLAAKDLGITILAVDQTPGMQVSSLTVVHEALTQKPLEEQCGHIVKALAAKYGGRWTCFKGWEKYMVTRESGTYLVITKGDVKVVVFRGEGR